MINMCGSFLVQDKTATCTYITEKYIAFKTTKISQFKKKWEMLEVFQLNLI